MPLARWVLSWLIALAVVTLRLTCRIRLHNDPRPKLRAAGAVYAYSVLHAHQIGVLIHRERGTAAMLSQSADGQLLAPALWSLGVIAKRGSSSSVTGEAHNKGGLAALRGLADNLRAGKPAILAVDGPRGPRGRVNKGIAVLAKQTGAAVLNVVAIPHRRWILAKAWDRFQIPKPFTRVEGYFGEPLFARQDESADEFRIRIEAQLAELEAKHDPEETCLARAATAKRAERRARRAA